MPSEISVLHFNAARQPYQRHEPPPTSSGYVPFGDDNDYPAYLLSLFDGSPKHNAIVRGKVTYISGNGWTTKGVKPTAAARRFIHRVNDRDSLYELSTRLAFDLELFGAAYIQVIWSQRGDRIAALHHADYASIRTNKLNTRFWYRHNWGSAGRPPIVVPAFEPEHPYGLQILMLRMYRPGRDAYALPGYLGCLNYLEADMEVSRHVLNHAQSGFTGSTHITLYEGDGISTDERRQIEQSLRRKFTGSSGQKIVVGFASSRELKPDIEKIGPSDLTRENFGIIDSLLQDNIYAGHQVTTPSIFGVSQAGRFGNTTEMRDGYEIFKATYANARQLFIEDAINKLAPLAGVDAPLQLVPVDPISIFTSPAISTAMTRGELREKAGLTDEISP